MADITSLASTVRHIDTQPGTPTKDFFNWLKKVSDFGAAWTGYTPTVTAGSGTLASYMASARYKEIGRTVLIQIDVTITGIGSAGGAIIVTLPRAAVSGQTYMINGREVAVTGNALVGQISGSTLTILTYNNAATAVAGWHLVLGGTYEEA